MTVTRTVHEETVGGTPELVRRWEPDGPAYATVIVVHGLGDHSGRYEAIGSGLAERGCAVVSFDLIGHGASGGRRGHVDEWHRYLDQVERHADAARADGAVVVMGHSMGGLVALDYTLSDHHDPDLLVLSAPSLTGGRAWQRLLAPVLAKIAPTLTIPTVFEGHQLSRDPAVGEAYFDDPKVLTKATARLGASILETGDRCRARIGELTVPTLVLHGGDDTIVPPTASLPLADSPMVERRLYPRLRHELFNEPEGEELLAEVAEWIRRRVG